MDAFYALLFVCMIRISSLELPTDRALFPHWTALRKAPPRHRIMINAHDTFAWRFGFGWQELPHKTRDLVLFRDSSRDSLPSDMRAKLDGDMYLSRDLSKAS